MKQRRIELASSFLRLSGKMLKRSPSLEKDFGKMLSMLSVNPFDPSLKTHSLKGRLKGKYACSLTYELRVVFKLTDEGITLLTIGPHDEVY